MNQNLPVNLCVADLGRVSYRDCWDWQKHAQKALIEKRINETIFFCEHPACFTYGSSTKLGDVLKRPEEVLRQQGYELINTDRGGNITYHGPGQLVCYPILNLNARKPDVNWYLRSLEEIVIELLAGFGISSFCIPSKTGIWTSPNDKICSIGVRFSRWCSIHGFSINLSALSEQGFELIYPCGIINARAISMQSLTQKIPDRQQVTEKLTELLLAKFYTEFGLEFTVGSAPRVYAAQNPLAEGCSFSVNSLKSTA